MIVLIIMYQLTVGIVIEFSINLIVWLQE
jgi:hypothetical protein